MLIIVFLSKESITQTTPPVAGQFLYSSHITLSSEAKVLRFSLFLLPEKKCFKTTLLKTFKKEYSSQFQDLTLVKTAIPVDEMLSQCNEPHQRIKRPSSMALLTALKQVISAIIPDTICKRLSFPRS